MSQMETMQAEIKSLKLKIAELEMRIDANEEKKTVKSYTKKPYYSIKEYAELYSVTPQTIYNQIYSGNIKAEKVGKIWRIPYKKS